MSGHVHHFTLPPPDGPTSVGRCKCGASRQFFNSVPERSISWRARTESSFRERETAGVVQSRDTAPEPEPGPVRKRMGRPMSISPEEAMEGARLIENGMTQMEAARTIGHSQPVLSRALKRLGVTPVSINHLRALGDDDVRAIRRRYGINGNTYVALAKEFGVSRESIFKIVKRTTYKDVPDDVV